MCKPSRIEQPEKYLVGWSARATAPGRKSPVASKFFSDKRYGGSQAALGAAERWTQETESMHERGWPEEALHDPVRLLPRSNTGIMYVHHCLTERGYHVNHRPSGCERRFGYGPLTGRTQAEALALAVQWAEQTNVLYEEGWPEEALPDPTPVVTRTATGVLGVRHDAKRQCFSCYHTNARINSHLYGSVSYGPRSGRTQAEAFALAVRRVE